MKAQTRLVLTLFAFGLAIWLSAGLFVWFAEVQAGAAQVTVFHLVSLAFIAGFSYLIAVSYSRRLKQLAEQAEAIRHDPGLPAIDLGGPNDELATVARSVNELKAKLTQGEELRNQLFADAAHELRTPVAIIHGHLETILKGAEELKPENLLPLLDETKRMSRLIQEMRDLNLAEAGRLMLDRSWVPLASMLHEIVSIMETEAEDKSITLRLHGDWPGELYCDVPRMKQVLINLIGNAIRYVPQGGDVEVSYAHDSGTVRIRVSDNGPGIPPDSLPYIFKRFYRVEASRSRMSGGTGLGLAIAKEFVEAHGGTIQAASRAGEGTTFTLSLPLYPLNP